MTVKSQLVSLVAVDNSTSNEQVDEAIAPSNTSTLIPTNVPDGIDNAETSDSWWDQQFVNYSEEQLGRYGVW